MLASLVQSMPPQSVAGYSMLRDSSKDIPCADKLCSTHLSDKNFYLRGDDWLIVNRWEQLMQLRSTLTFVEMVTWYERHITSDIFDPSQAETLL